MSSDTKLEMVRLSFPDIWKAKAVQEGGEPKYGAVFLLDKKEHASLIESLKVQIVAAAKEKFGADEVKALRAKKPPKLTFCLHEGDEKDYEGYGPDIMFITASSKRRPLIVDKDRTALAEDDGRPYAGCYVDAMIRLWVQDNQFGKKVNAELLGIQFRKDGEAFGAAPLTPDAFDDHSDEKGDEAESANGDKAKGDKAKGGKSDKSEDIEF